MKVIITFAFHCDNRWKSKFMALEKAGKLREFFSRTLWQPCYCIANFQCTETDYLHKISLLLEFKLKN